jgi:hypothetical protein
VDTGELNQAAGPGGMDRQYEPVPDLGDMPRRRGLGSWRMRRLGCLGELMLLMVLMPVAFILPNPWALHMGGRFTPLESWQGFGPAQASNGGRYLLYLSLRGGYVAYTFSKTFGGRGFPYSLSGAAELCTESGRTYAFDVEGSVGGWLSTDGAATSVDLVDGPRSLGKYVVDLPGAWHGPALYLASPDHFFTELFTARGAIRPLPTTAHAGTAHFTIRYGTKSDFTAACTLLRG